MTVGVHERPRRLPAAAAAAVSAACLALTTATLATPRGAFRTALAGGDVAGEAGVLVAVPRLTLEAISAAELTPGPGAAGNFDLGPWRGTESRFALPSLRTEVARRIPSLWRLRVDDTASLDVRYEITALSGRAQRLSHVDHPEAELGVRLQALPPEVVVRDGEAAVLEGGVILWLGIDHTRYAGSYVGTLTVTLHQL